MTAMKNDSMTFSVIIPVYNAADYLPTAVESVLSQGVPCELILVDDGSTDESGALCDGYAAEHANVKVLHKQNEYLGAARNSGLTLATGTHVYFLDADDRMGEGVLRAALAYPDADVICSNRFCARDWAGTYLKTRTGSFTDEMPQPVKNTRLAEFSPYTAQSIYRRAFILAEGVFFNETRMNAEDRDWTVRLLYRSKRTAVLDIPMYYYTEKREGSLMTNVHAAYTFDSLCVLAELYHDVDDMPYTPVSAVKHKIANEYLCFAVCAALIRDKALRRRTMAHVYTRLDILKKDSSAKYFLWLRWVIGLRNLLKLCNLVFLHYRTDA